MGIYLNPGNENFQSAIRSEFYIDKTKMLSELSKKIGTQDRFITVSRARRFGKTIAASMMAAYYSKGCDSREMFAPFKVSHDETFETHLNKYNVISLDLNGDYRNDIEPENFFKHLNLTVCKNFVKQYPDLDFTGINTIGDSIKLVYENYGETFIIIMDEYDVFVREKVSGNLFTSYLNFLNGLFKNSSIAPAISLAYLTGILPIVRDKVESKLNNFTEYTMVDPDKLAEYVGFTADEVKDLCGKFNVSYDECKRWYDGYRLDKYEVYNPKAIYSAITRNKFKSYWGITGSYEAVSDYIAMNFEGTKDDVIKMMSGERGTVNVTGFMNTKTDFRDKDDVFTYLIHLGYLAYDAKTRECYIPNKEVFEQWEFALRRCDEYEVTNRIIKDSRNLLEATLAYDEAAVAAALDRSHIHVTSNRNYNNEDCLQSAIYLAYIYALNDYTIIKEMTTGRGFADIVYIPVEPNTPALIVELKRNKDADTALTQIREKKYFAALEKYSGNILFVGVNYDTETKEHTCKIEKFVK